MTLMEMVKKTTRNAFGRAVWELAQEDESVVAVAADTATNLGLSEMMKEFPERVINVGIAEQNMMDICAGLAVSGFRSYACSYAPFLTMRALEQFRTFIAYPNLNVQLGGGMGGISAGAEGVTHQAAEDAALMRCIANSVVICPSDFYSCYVIVKAMGKYNGPVYYRLDKIAYKLVFDENYHFELGKANMIQDGSDITLISNGIVFANTMEACGLLEKEGIHVRLLEMPCIKPIDEEAIVAAAKDTGAIMTVEEGILQGGLGSAVSEVVCRTHPVIMKSLGLDNTFAESGEVGPLLDKYGLDARSITDAAKELIERKKAQEESR